MKLGIVRFAEVNLTMPCFGKTPMQTFLDSKHIAIEKQLNRTFQTTESVLATA